jgi:hypothetical protein
MAFAPGKVRVVGVGKITVIILLFNDACNIINVQQWPKRSARGSTLAVQAVHGFSEWGGIRAVDLAWRRSTTV